jgi:iron(III) transport system substrate-binding protein
MGGTVTTGFLKHAPLKAALAIAVLAGGILAPAAKSYADDFDKIKAAAEKEGTLVLWATSPREYTTPKLEQLFNKRFGTNINISRVAVEGGNVDSRLIAEAQGGKISVDVFVANDRHLPTLTKRNLLEKVDWVATFGDHIDKNLLKDAADDVMPEFAGYAMGFYDSLFGIMYNTNAVTPDQAPTKWEDLADPKWQRKISIDNELSPLSRLVPIIGKDKVLDLGKRIVANNPVFVNNITNVPARVVSGETPVGAATLTAALAEKNKGAPVELVYPEPQAIASQQLLFIAKGAPHPNLAKLFVAWLGSEGMLTEPMIAEGSLRARPGAPGAFGKYYTEHNLTVKHAKTMDELQETVTIRKPLQALVRTR